MNVDLITPLVLPIPDVVIDERSREWCKLKYPDHPYGCPNYGRKIGCPPNTPLFRNVIKPPYVLVGIRFDLQGWAKSLKERHPEMSDRQVRCCLYWQGAVRKQLRILCNTVKKQFQNPFVDFCPEAGGIHVFETCYKNGIKLYKNPQDFVWKIAIIGERVDKTNQ